MNLISTTDFALEQRNKHKYQEYAKFLKQPLEIWMFVPCDEDGNVLEIPINHEFYMKNFNGTCCDYFVKNYEYQQAKEKCLFEGFELVLQNDFFYTIYRRADGCSILLEKLGDRKIESLIQNEIELTPTAIKKIGL